MSIPSGFTPEQRARIDRVAGEAISRPVGERAAFVAAQCSGDEAVRVEVLAILAHVEDTEQSEFLKSPAELPTMGSAAEFAPTISSAGKGLSEAPPTHIGRYRIFSKIGEGGFGVVYMAEQREPVQRKVALKIIKLGMDTKQVIARFEQERQALALMDHPHIAKVLDAGATESGRPYFVMELVSGDPITEYCDRNSLSIHDRLSLFIQVCQAVQHAHAKGIIHRDIKPSNILVSTHDGRPHARVIDFGIAKATAARLTEKTFFTEHRQLIGTPQYMSPEQAEASLDIDTRTDVYSLGVLLYELLTGVTPFDARSLRSAAFAEIQRIIREVEPSKPSTRLSTLKDTLAGVAARRQIEPRRLSSIVRGDLDWIVMKALEKDRSRRYETANGFAMDIQRHLAGEAVVAAPPSAVYQLQKFVRRNRGVVVAATLVAAALILGMVGTSIGLVRAEAQRKLAESARADEAVQRRLAEQERDRAVEAERKEREQRSLAEKREKEAARIAEFQASMLSKTDVETMGRGIRSDFRSQVEAGLHSRFVDADGGQMRKMSEAEIAAALLRFDEAVAPANPTDVARHSIDVNFLSPAVEASRKDFVDQPLVEASLLSTLGSIFLSLDLHREGEALYRRALELRKGALGNEHTLVANSMGNVANALLLKGEHDAAEPFYRGSLEIHSKLSGPESSNAATSMSEMAKLLRAKGEYAEAEKMLRRALEIHRRALGNESIEVASDISTLALVLANRGDLAGAETLHREALTLERKLYGENHPGVALGMVNLAELLRQRGNLTEAEALMRDALAMQRRMHGEVHSEVAVALNNLAAALFSKGDYDAAEPPYREAMATFRKILGDEHLQVSIAMNNLGLLLQRKGNYNEAELLFRQSLAMRRRLLGNGHDMVATSALALGDLLREKRDYTGAEVHYREATSIFERLLGREHINVALCMNNLGFMLYEKGDFAASEPLLRDALAILRKQLGLDHSFVGACLNNLAMVVEDKGDPAAAEPLYRESLAIRRKSLGNEHPEVATGLSNLGLLLHSRGADAEAEPLYREAMSILEKRLPKGHVDTTMVQSSLGAVLTALKKFDEAEGLLTKAWQAFSDSETTSPRNREVCQKRIIKLYEARESAEPGKGYDRKAADWREKLYAWQATTRPATTGPAAGS